MAIAVAAQFVVVWQEKGGLWYVGRGEQVIRWSEGSWGTAFRWYGIVGHLRLGLSCWDACRRVERKCRVILHLNRSRIDMRRSRLISKTLVLLAHIHTVTLKAKASMLGHIRLRSHLHTGGYAIYKVLVHEDVLPQLRVF